MTATSNRFNLTTGTGTTMTVGSGSTATSLAWQARGDKAANECTFYVETDQALTATVEVLNPATGSWIHLENAVAVAVAAGTGTARTIEVTHPISLARLELSNAGGTDANASVWIDAVE